MHTHTHARTSKGHSQRSFPRPARATHTAHARRAAGKWPGPDGQCRCSAWARRPWAPSSAPPTTARAWRLCAPRSAQVRAVLCCAPRHRPPIGEKHGPQPPRHHPHRHQPGGHGAVVRPRQERDGVGQGPRGHPSLGLLPDHKSWTVRTVGATRPARRRGLGHTACPPARLRPHSLPAAVPPFPRTTPLTPPPMLRPAAQLRAAPAENVRLPRRARAGQH